MSIPEHDLFTQPGDPAGKRAIVAAALRLFATRGVDGVSIRDIGDAAGLTNPALFRHFRSKEDLAFQLFQIGYGRLTEAFGAEASHDGDRLDAVFAAGLALIERAPHGVHFVLDNIARYFRDLPEPMRRASLLNEARSLVAAEISAGRLRADIDPDLVAILLLGALSQVARMALFSELDRPAAALSGPLLALLRQGLETPL